MKFIDSAKCSTHVTSKDTISCELYVSAHTRFYINISDNIPYEEYLADAKVDLARLVYGEFADNLMRVMIKVKQGPEVRSQYDGIFSQHDREILQMLEDIYKQLGVNG